MGATENDNVAIESGVKPGELVVTDGIDRLREGAKVEVTTPFVPRARGPGRLGGSGGDPSERGNRQAKGGAEPAAPTPAPVSGAATSNKPSLPATDKTAPTDQPADSAAKPAQSPPEPPKSSGWRDMSDEQKAALRKKMENMSDEEKAEFRKKQRERAQN